MPTRSLAKLLIICVTSCLDFSKRLGATSSANMLLETSIAKTISTPSLFIVSSFVPIFGFINPITKNPTARQRVINLRDDLKNDKSGLNLFRTTALPKDFWILFFQKKVHKNTINITGMMINAQNHIFSSN